jgi:hypothetical protein
VRPSASEQVTQCYLDGRRYSQVSTMGMSVRASRQSAAKRPAPTSPVHSEQRPRPRCSRQRSTWPSACTAKRCARRASGRRRSARTSSAARNRCRRCRGRSPAVRPGSPDELGAGEQELLVETRGCRRDDASSAVAPRSRISPCHSSSPQSSAAIGQLARRSSVTAVRASASDVPVTSGSRRSSGRRSAPGSRTFVFVPIPCDAPIPFPYGDSSITRRSSVASRARRRSRATRPPSDRRRSGRA